jgi:hypothetical protein
MLQIYTASRLKYKGKFVPYLIKNHAMKKMED